MIDLTKRNHQNTKNSGRNVVWHLATFKNSEKSKKKWDLKVYVSNIKNCVMGGVNARGSPKGQK